MARILVADDAFDMRILIEAILARDGHEVVTAADGLEALHRYRTEPFDVICSDLDMPGLNGVELTRAVRLHPGGGPPILLVSGSGSPQDIREAHEAGISAFVEKPFTVASLRGQVRALLEPVQDTGFLNATTTDSCANRRPPGSSGGRLKRCSPCDEPGFRRSVSERES
jgi:CheY-like chemotaxis protein